MKERQKLYGQVQELQKELKEKVSQEQALIREKVGRKVQQVSLQREMAASFRVG